jgi:Cdc6-like AAA superfamily ATPase
MRHISEELGGSRAKRLARFRALRAEQDAQQRAKEAQEREGERTVRKEARERARQEQAAERERKRQNLLAERARRAAERASEAAQRGPGGRSRPRAPPMPSRGRHAERLRAQREILLQAVITASARNASGFATTGEVFDAYRETPKPPGVRTLTGRRITDLLRGLAEEALVQRHPNDGGCYGRTHLYALPARTMRQDVDA